jgi:cytochrome c biogenesis protein ResB
MISVLWWFLYLLAFAVVYSASIVICDRWVAKKREEAYRAIRKEIEEENSPDDIKQTRLQFLDMAYITGAKIVKEKKYGRIVI